MGSRPSDQAGSRPLTRRRLCEVLRTSEVELRVKSRPQTPRVPRLAVADGLRVHRLVERPRDAPSCTHTHTTDSLSFTHIQTRTHARAQTRIHIHTSAHALTHARAHSHTFKHTRTHKHRNTQKLGNRFRTNALTLKMISHDRDERALRASVLQS